MRLVPGIERLTNIRSARVEDNLPWLAALVDWVQLCGVWDHHHHYFTTISISHWHWGGHQRTNPLCKRVATSRRAGPGRVRVRCLGTGRPVTGSAVGPGGPGPGPTPAHHILVRRQEGNVERDGWQGVGYQMAERGGWVPSWSGEMHHNMGGDQPQ